jgi:CheY-like chemotaxis protein
VNKTVIIADDAAITRHLLKVTLNKLPLDFVEATSGVQTIRAIKAHNPDLVLLDVSMPPPDGLIVLKRIRQSPEYGQLPVILVTVEDGPECREAMEKWGVQGYFSKPLDLPALRQKVCALLFADDPLPECLADSSSQPN